MAYRGRKLDRQACLAVYEAVESGQTQLKAAKAAGVSAGNASVWLRNPARFDPYFDEIALSRALSGDLSAFRALTVWEVHAFWDRLLQERRKLLPFEWEWRCAALRGALQLSPKLWEMALERAAAREAA